MTDMLMGVRVVELSAWTCVPAACTLLSESGDREEIFDFDVELMV
jgi:hypothetical protein